MADNVSTAAGAADNPKTSSPIQADRMLPASPTHKQLPPPAAEPEKHSESHHAVLVVLVLVIIGAIIGYYIYKHQQRPPTRTMPPITVSVTNAAVGNINETVDGLGTVTPVQTAMISPRVDGQLLKVAFTEGQMVTTNDLLAEIDPRPYQAALTQAKGQLARDKAQLEGANVDLSRYEQAYGRGFGTNLHAVPKQQVDDQRATVHQVEGTVQLDEAAVASAEVQLDYCYIRAPFTGRTGLRLIDPGNVVHAANTNPIVVVAQLQPITVIFTVDQKYLPAMQAQLNRGREMVVQALNQDKTEVLSTGRFLTTDNQIDISTGTIKIRSLFQNEDNMLFPNEFVNARLIITTLSNVTLIPTVAVQRNPQGAFVYLLNQKEMTVTNQVEGQPPQVVQTNAYTVAMRDITTGITEGDVTQVTGIEPGEVIVTDNFNKLGEGMRVNPRQGRGEGRQGGAPGGRKGGKGGRKGQAQDDAQ